jgi:hypothetical protein
MEPKKRAAVIENGNCRQRRSVDFAEALSAHRRCSPTQTKRAQPHRCHRLDGTRLAVDVGLIVGDQLNQPDLTALCVAMRC